MLVTALAACGEKEPVDRMPGSAALREARRTGLQTGDLAPALAGPSLLGETIDLAELRGRPVLVNFWASNCIPCRREFPLLAAALSSNASLSVVGVAVLDRRADALRFMKEHGSAWDSLLDREARIATSWRVRVLPVTYAITAEGRIGDRQFGELTAPALARMLRAIASS